MAEFQWWLLIVGLVAGGGLVAVLSMDAARRDVDITDLEREAEAGLVAAQLSDEGWAIEPVTVAAVLRAHADYLKLPPPDHLEVLGDGDSDEPPDRVRDDRGGYPDDDLAATREQRPPARQEADAGADGEERGERQPDGPDEAALAGRE
jgi:hypothetical protein